MYCLRAEGLWLIVTVRIPLWSLCSENAATSEAKHCAQTLRSGSSATQPLDFGVTFVLSSRNHPSVETRDLLSSLGCGPWLKYSMDPHINALEEERSVHLSSPYLGH